jgi:transcriptional regulator with XRE-family HTH domain
MATMNRGSTALAAQLSEHGATSALARDLGVSHVSVVRWASGDRLPETRFRLALLDRYAIPLLAWDDALPASPDADAAEVAS